MEKTKSVLHIEVSREEKAAWVAAAQRRRKSLLAWVAEHLNRAARAELEDKSHDQAKNRL